MTSDLQARLECKTDTQYIVNLSGYAWGVEQVGSLEDSVVLDAACGAGYGSFYLAEKARIVVGIDKSKIGIGYCKKNYKADNLMFVQMDCLEMAFRNHTFNFVFSLETIEHVTDDRMFLSEMCRVLKKEGAFIISTPHGKKGVKPTTPSHFREYTPEEFRNLLKEYFKDVVLYGRRLKPELLRLENNLDAVRKWDKLGFRKFIPRKIRHSIGNWVARRSGDITLNEVSVKHIDYTKDLQGAITLIAVCKKI